MSVVLPAIIFEHMNEFNYKFAFFVLLTVFVCVFILPTKGCFTTYNRKLWRWQKISATWCSPVRRTLCSAGPEPMLTTESNRYALPCEPWKLFEIRLTWEARWARQCTQLYVFCSSSKYSWNRRILCAPWPPAPTFLRRCRHPPNNLTRLLQITPKIFTVSRVILDF